MTSIIWFYIEGGISRKLHYANYKLYLNSTLINYSFAMYFIEQLHLKQVFIHKQIQHSLRKGFTAYISHHIIEELLIYQQAKMSIQYNISETITKVKYCNLDSCYFVFQNDPVSSVLNRLCYFTWHQDLGLEPKPIKVKWESFDFNGICARPVSPCKSNFSPIHTRNLFQWILRFFLLFMGGEFEEWRGMEF